jgi:hypothetical protein
VISRDEADQPNYPANDSPLSANLLPPVLGLLAIGLVAWAVGVLDDNQPEDAPMPCAAIVSDPARLDCYDRRALPHPPAKGALAPVRIYPPEDMK